MPMCLLLGASLFVLVLTFSLLRAAISPLRRLPGPALARFTRLWYFKAAASRRFEHVNIRLHQQHGILIFVGSIVRIAPNQYSLDDPEAVKVIYGHGTEFIKSPWYSAAVAPGQSHDLFAEPNPKIHAANRRKVASLYSTSNLLKFEPYVDTSVGIFVEQMRELGRRGDIFDLQHWLQCYAFDVIGLITFNKRFGFMDEGDDRGLFANLHSYLIYVTHVGIFNEFHKLIYWVKSKLGSSGRSYMVDFAQAELRDASTAAEGNEKLAGREDFVAKLLRSHWQDPAGFPMAKVFATAITNVGAGSDTTSVSLSGVLYHLMRTPECYNKLRAEIDNAAATGKASNPIQYHEAQALPYLQACIKEGLRMHPATGLPLARVVPAGGATLAGTYFPAGTVVGINSWVAHHNKAVFGEDAAQFRPERWLDEPERVSKMDRYYMPFGVGSRTCIGRNISLLEISKLIPELIRNFDFSLAYPNEKLETENLWFVKQTNLLCRVRERM
ncbi:uncharacterized protein HMPREF1541_02288 [Cyphellophora europaea CBS 101466]|uniref:Cytochrome P450 oxidoreductase n=1 Tax=Cyphellophora europaea (strain CBS 101466) TaxID=1220924 RepID=W2S3E4_CYPE1|nr:uncharacterized protein HMPREF1541_02288 [Cyphellophora europaea CBS 101466]ETN43130.1 hypothetical protein HMPREF1541_02288 [Cyphellophora europaea CBS 101466]